ncbi:hypothetical protein C5167_017023 [Papaver somniferum]|uniref:Homeobox domain-containing protein n=1 Tax=Papaver somniferum TaxID=3469 RepID=A0A4Y7IKF5_PAPSO|nr:WUSCHEL-related homeobox 8-like [Papaver somniferum]RZC48596.1 hypothetical protein C5167_017023 [Papaver somniferum]
MMGIMRNGDGEEEYMRRIMEWDKPPGAAKQEQQQQVQEEENNGGVIYVKVMTDEQIEDLRKQISVYASICEQLVQMHKAITAQQDLSGMRLGNLYCDPMMTSGSHKITTRQRWTPTPIQLQILERIFEQGNGTPSKQKIKDITSELTQHGQIVETNVYNWFQNRRARSKRKQLGNAPNNAESEVETEVESPEEKKAKSDRTFTHENSSMRRVEEGCFHNSDLHSLDPHSNKAADSVFPSDSGSKSSGSLGHVSFYENVLSNPRIDQLMGKMEMPGNYSPYRHGENYDLM